jgi:RNA polymerase sigma factor for flagellar operon FliA
MGRAAMLDTYTSFARMLAAKTYSQRTSRELPFADYLQFAMVGLLEAIDRFDPNRGVKFESFAGPRIQGAILDGVESLSEVQKQVAVRHRMLRERQSSLADGNPVGAESALEQLAALAIGLALGFALEDSGIYACGERVSRETPYSGLEMRQTRLQLQALVQRLPAPERTVVHRHYFQQVPLSEIAESMSLTPGRISQLHKAALDRLRSWRLNEDFGVTRL